MKKLLLLLFVSISVPVCAQPPITIKGPIDRNVANTNNNVVATGYAIPGIPTGSVTATTTPSTTAQWHFAGSLSGHGIFPFVTGSNVVPSHDWIYDIAPTDKKEYIACGYGLGVDGEHHVSGTVLKLDHMGRLAWGKCVTSIDSGGITVTDRYSVLWQVKKAANGEYVCVGFKDGHMLLVVVDDDGNFLYGTPKTFIMPTNAPDLLGGFLSTATIDWGNTTPGNCRGFSVAIDPVTESATNIIVGGPMVITDNTYHQTYSMAYIATLNYTAGSWSIGKRYFAGNHYGPTAKGGNTVVQILTKVNPGGGYDIYGCGAISGPDDNIVRHVPGITDTVDLGDIDKDIWVFSIPSDFSAENFSQVYNKANTRLDGTGGSGLLLNNLAAYPYTDVGPLSARNFYPLAGPHPGIIRTKYLGTDYYPASTVYLNFYNNKNEEAHDMIFTSDGKIALVAAVNVIGQNRNNLANNGGKNVMVPTATSPLSFAGAALGYTKEYVDGDGFLMKINPANGNLIYAKNVGHFSGQNFKLSVAQDPESNFIIGGSTADKYSSSDYNLPDPPDYHGAAYIVATTDNPTSTNFARRCYLSSDSRATDVLSDGNCNNIEHDFCLFTLKGTADGGYIIGGNDTNSTDDFTITKFAPLFQQRLTGLGVYEDFGLGYTPATYTLSSSETWSSTVKSIGSKIVIPSGVTLTINNSTIAFASSDHLWDYWQAPNVFTGSGIGCGIVVQPGGKLIVENGSRLSGISITGEHNMWDGIVLQGDPSQSNISYQGQVIVSGNSIIEDARDGIFVADIYRTYINGTTSYGRFSGTTHGTRYKGFTTKGGGRILASDATFENCDYGVVFQKAPIAAYESAFENCVFNSTSTGLGDICVNTDGLGRLNPGTAHLSSWHAKRMRIHGSTFTCNTAFDEGIRPVGIVTNTTQIRISSATPLLGSPIAGNTFSNLRTGISAQNVPGISPMINISGNTFENNSYGANVQGTHFGLIMKNNTFKVPEAPSYASRLRVGLTLAGCTGYDVSDNTFQSVSTTNYWLSNGAVINNGHTGDEFFKRNMFVDNLMFGSVALGTNGSDATGTGLQFKCNDYTHQNGIIRSSNIVGFTSTPCVIRPHQGDCGSVTSPAGNSFHYCTGGISPGDGKIISFDNDIAQVVTYNNNYASSIFDPGSCAQYIHPITSATILVNIPCLSFGGEPLVADACPTPYAYGDWSSSGMTLASADLILLEGLIANNSDPDVAITLETQLNEILGYMARFYSDSASYDTAAALLADHGRYAEALPFYIMAGDYQNATIMLGYLPQNTPEEQLYAAAMEMAIDLYSNGDTWMDIDNETRDILAGMVQYDSRTGYMAGAISALVGTVPVTWPLPLIDSAVLDSIIADTSTWFQKPAIGPHTAPITDNGKAGGSFSLYPNPTNGNLIVNASSDGKFTLYTILGQKLQEYTITAGQTELYLPKGMTAGIYMGVYKTGDGRETSEVKIVYQP